jgi:plastocyanin
MTKRLMALALAAITGLAMAACSSSTPAATDGGAADGGAAGGDAGAWTVRTLDTFAFEPNAWTATAGQTIELTLDNTGQALEHTWVLTAMGTTMEDAVTLPDTEPDARKVFEARVPAGEMSTTSFTAPAEPGEYVVVCAVAGHAAGGMVGTLTVQ